MKIEIREASPKNWTWRTCRGGNTTSWSAGYDTRAGVERAIASEAAAWAKLALGRPLNADEKAAAKERSKRATVLLGTKA